MCRHSPSLLSIYFSIRSLFIDFVFFINNESKLLAISLISIFLKC
ncbi:hypothetical protein BCAH1134_C0212 (plasmid) [Bacillus cereus AH1134]|nr:hypothetical protein BCAH1134_C0212 [Bacillus cereus AH1134]